MLSALYYPHTRIRSTRVLKNALLLWDSVTCIVPWEDWNPEHSASVSPDILSDAPRELREAEELVVQYHVPTEQEKQKAHADIDSFVRSGSYKMVLGADHPLLDLDEDGPAQVRSQRPDYLIYPDKFLRETWQALRNEGLANWDIPSNDYSVSPGLGLLMMSLLADACAGTQKQKVTDRVRAYSWVEARRAQTNGGEVVQAPDVGDFSPDLDCLVTLTLEVLDATAIPIKRLIELRKREKSGSGADYRAFRLRYLERLRGYIARITTEARGPGDVEEIGRQFKWEMKDDLELLRRELNLAGIKALFSKEVALSAVVLAGALAAPIASFTGLVVTLKGIGVAPLVRTLAEYRAARLKALREHPISWLYLGQQSRLTFR